MINQSLPRRHDGASGKLSRPSWDVFMQFCSKVMTQHISEAAQFPFHCGQKPSLAPQFLVCWWVTFCLIVNSSHWRTTSQTLTTYRHKLNVREGIWYRPTKPHTHTHTVYPDLVVELNPRLQFPHHWLCPWVMKKNTISFEETMSNAQPFKVVFILALDFTQFSAFPFHRADRLVW